VLAAALAPALALALAPALALVLAAALTSGAPSFRPRVEHAVMAPNATIPATAIRLSTLRTSRPRTPMLSLSLRASTRATAREQTAKSTRDRTKRCLPTATIRKFAGNSSTEQRDGARHGRFQVVAPSELG
jgi:hypothetical protein